MTASLTWLPMRYGTLPFDQLPPDCLCVNEPGLK